MQDSYHPYDYINSLKRSKHVTLLYEEPEYAKILEFQFINNGIRKGEPSIYAMHDDVEIIEEEMKDFGIDVDHAKSKGLLFIYNIPDPREYKDLLKRAEEIYSRVTRGLSRYRLVCRLVESVDSIDACLAVKLLEGTWHKIFDELDCILLCPYYILEVPRSIFKDWFVSILQNHHGVIFAPKMDYGIAFDLQE